MNKLRTRVCYSIAEFNEFLEKLPVERLHSWNMTPTPGDFRFVIVYVGLEI